jgi:integrase
MNIFRSAFAAHLTRYVELRRGLGFRFVTQVAELRAFDRFAADRRALPPLTQTLALDFAGSGGHDSAALAARRYHVVRLFADYVATFEPSSPPLDPRALTRPGRKLLPHIYSPEELARLLAAAAKLSARHPLRGLTLQTMVGLAASSGLRISEVAGLDRVDVDLATGVLTIRRSKFNKDRLVPVHLSTRDALQRYAVRRDAAWPTLRSPAFFLQQRGGRFSKHTIQTSFWELTRAVGLCGDKGKGPRFHDLRHTFAVRRLTEWYAAGLDVQALLPSLATYLGHGHYTDTAWYLTATPELLSLAGARAERALAPEVRP